MSGGPPRARPRVVPPAPAQPYPHAADYDPPVDVEAEPIPLTSDDVPTMKDLGDKLDRVELRVSNVQVDLARLRTYVMGDHAPRITAVEKRLPPLPPWVKKGGAYGAIAAAYPLLEWLIPLAQKWIESR